MALSHSLFNNGVIHKEVKKMKLINSGNNLLGLRIALVENYLDTITYISCSF